MAGPAVSPGDLVATVGDALDPEGLVLVAHPGPPAQWMIAALRDSLPVPVVVVAADDDPAARDPLPDRGVIVFDLEHAPPALTEAWFVDRPDRRTVEVRCHVAGDLVDRPDVTDPDRIVADTSGLPHLVEQIIDAGCLDDEVVRRRRLLDRQSWLVLVFTSFGLDEAAIASLGADVLDRSWSTLQQYGLVRRRVVPPAVASAVRRSSSRVDQGLVAAAAADPSGSRAVVELLVEVDAVGTDVARLVLSEAARTVMSDPDGAAVLAAAAGAAGADPNEVAVVSATAMLASGDPSGAATALREVTGGDAALIRAAACIRLGDRAAALASVDRHGFETWAVVIDPGRCAEVSDDGSPESLLALTLRRWLVAADADPAGLVDDFVRAARRYEIAPTPTPVHPGHVAVYAARRLCVPVDPELPRGAGDDVTATLLGAWATAADGELAVARRRLESIEVSGSDPAQRFLFAAALCAVASRDPSASGVSEAAEMARRALLSWQPGPVELGPATDVGMACVRSGDLTTDPFRAARSTVGGSSSWRMSFDVAVATFRAALSGDDLQRVIGSASAVVDAASGGSRSEADDVWVRAADVAAADWSGVGSAPDVAGVVAVGSDLVSLGYAHDAGRLCAAVALSTADATTAKRLLRQSRTWRVERTRLGNGSGKGVSTLSEQEERVGRLLLDGHTHKQIGAALFVSPKTVEHHAAHIRTKLAAADRSEMMRALQAYFDR